MTANKPWCLKLRMINHDSGLYNEHDYQFSEGMSRDDVEREIDVDHVDDLASRILGSPVRILGKSVMLDHDTFRITVVEWEYAGDAEPAEAWG